MFNYAKLTPAMRRVMGARERIARRNPFFASILFNANIVESDRHKTLWSDGINVYFNPDYVEANDEFIEGDILECVMHAALQHFGRRKYRNSDKWNEACDLSVRPLVHQYFKQHPSLMAKDGLYPNKAAEEIYELLEDQEGGQGKGPKQPGDGQNDPDNMPGSMVDPEDSEAAEQAGRNWKRAVENAAEKAKKAGNMPGNLQRLIEELLPAEKLDWRDILRDWSRDAKSKRSRSWSRINRRRQDPLMPGYGNDNIFNIIICFDVSGSVTDEMLKSMKTEIAALLDQDLCNQATLIAVDTCPRSIQVVTNSQGVIDWKPVGGGGTDFTSALDLINKDYAGSMGLLFLTDLETCSFGKEPNMPVCWVNFAAGNRLKAPYGRTVDY